MEVDPLAAEVERVGDGAFVRRTSGETAAEPSAGVHPRRAPAQRVAGLSDLEGQRSTEVGVGVRDGAFPDAGQDAGTVVGIDDVAARSNGEGEDHEDEQGL